MRLRSATVVPLASEQWAWEVPHRFTEHLGRPCVSLEGSALATIRGIELADGVIEADLAVGAERGFPGVVWRIQDDENFESFFVRPHQVGNPDAVQYTPVFNGISSWQLYHGPGFWAPVVFPIGEWFTIRVAFAGTRAEVYVADLDEPALVIAELKRPAVPGGVGVLVGGSLHLAEFRYDPGEVELRSPTPARDPAVDGVVPAWWVSDAFPEAEIPARLDGFAARTWSRLASEPSGLADLSQVNGIRGGSNSVFARATIRASGAQTKRLDFGFSDRAVVYLNGEPLYRGGDSYRSRDYRFLGSIGYYDTLFLQLRDGDNELVFAVSEDFGGWGVQARLRDLT